MPRASDFGLRGAKARRSASANPALGPEGVIEQIEDTEVPQGGVHERTVPVFALSPLVAVVFSGALLAQAPQAPPPDQAAPTFQAQTLLVPVDVRVVDGNGKPVTDLTQADFTILEDGVPQDIRHFANWRSHRRLLPRWR